MTPESNDMSDIAVIRLERGTTSEDFHRFVGALAAAKRLGYNVTLRVVNDPIVQGQIVPLDIYAEASRAAVPAPSDHREPTNGTE